MRNYTRLNMVNLPREDRRDVLAINGGDKREIARQLVEMFQNGGKNPDNFNFRNVNLSGADLRGLNLRVLGAKALRQINFAGANLSGQNFRHLNLRGFYAPGAKLDYANLENANLEKVQGGSVSFFGVQATGLNLNYAKLVGCNWEGNFRGAKIAAVKMTYGYFGEGSNFELAQMRGSDMTGAIYTSGEPSFRRAEMQQSILRGDFRNANFAGANLAEAKLDGGTFTNAIFPAVITTNTKQSDEAYVAIRRTKSPDKYAVLKLVASTPMPTAPAPGASYRRKPLHQLQYAA